jgi:hypothetical protein
MERFVEDLILECVELEQLLIDEEKSFLDLKLKTIAKLIYKDCSIQEEVDSWQSYLFGLKKLYNEKTYK